MLNTFQRIVTFSPWLRWLLVACHLAPCRTTARQEACPPPTPCYISPLVLPSLVHSSLLARPLLLCLALSAPLPLVGGSPVRGIVPPTHGCGVGVCLLSPPLRLRALSGGARSPRPSGRTSLTAEGSPPHRPLPVLFPHCSSLVPIMVTFRMAIFHRGAVV